MLIRIVRLTLHPERVADFLALFRQSESRIRQQPGCQHLELWQDADQPHIYCTHSHWHDAAALDTYQRGAVWGGVAGYQTPAGRPSASICGGASY